VLSNPLENPLFPHTVQVVVALLGAALVLLLGAERHHLKEVTRRPLFTRWRTWVLIAPIYTLAVLSGPAATALLVLGLSLQGLREYASLVGLPGPYRAVLIMLGALAAPSALISLDVFGALPPVLLLIATLQPLLLADVRSGVRHLAFAVLGWAYLAWLLSFAVVIRAHIPGGDGLLLMIGLAVALSDIGAFTVGSSLGRHALAPRLSPNKTWEGLGGNVLGALAGVGLMSFAWPAAVSWPLAIGLGTLIGLGAAWGDLVESALKREFGAKDAGAWLPGFGGLLDRIDSLVIVVPVVYFAVRLTTQV
jgi:phosphatidate cytidylyltransferase